MGSNLDVRNTIRVDERIAVVLALVLAVVLVAFEWTTVGDEYVAVRRVAGVLAALFVPGFLLLRVVRIDRPVAQTVVYSVALSSAFLVLVGATTNFLLPGLGVERPLAWTPLVLALSLVGLAALAYRRTTVRPVRRRTITLSPRTLLAGGLIVLLPLLSVAATRAMNVRGEEAPMLVLILLVAGAVPLLVWGAIPSGLRPFAVWSVSLSVLWAMTLVTPHVWGWDVHFEYAAARTIYETGTWAPADGPLVSTTFLAAIYTRVTGVELVRIYKVLYPVVASLLPVAVYFLARRQFDDERVAVLAPFCLVFYYGFFKTMPAKQMIAQLFLVLVLVVLFDRSIGGVRKRALAVTFGTMMILSHYIVSLFAVGFLAATIVVVALARRSDVIDTPDAGVVSPTFVALLGVEWVGWHRYSGSGETFGRVVRQGYAAVTAFGGPASGRSGVGYATRAFDSHLWSVYRLLYIALIGLFTVGLLWTLYSIVVRDDAETDPEYPIFGAFVVALLTSSLVITFGIGFDRVLLLSLAVLAPFAPVGATAGFTVVSKLSRGLIDLSPNGIANVFAAFLAVLFLFSSGGAFAMAGEDVPSYSINLDRDAGWPAYDRGEVEATRWLADEMDPEANVAVYNEWDMIKSRDGVLVREVVPRERIILVAPATTRLEDGAYIYVSDKPMAEVGDRDAYIDPEGTEFYASNVASANLIYAGDGVRIYRARTSGDGGEEASNPGTDPPDER